MIMKLILALLGFLGTSALVPAQQPAPAAAAPAPAVPGAAAAPAAPAPAPKEKKDTLPIKITSTGGAEVVPEKNLIVWLENVRFEHPEQKILMTCDRLEVYQEPPPPPKPKPALEEEAGKKGSAPGPAAPEPAPEPEIKSAIAYGHVYLEKLSPRGEKRVGRGKKAVFDAKTRDVQLTGLPSLDVDQHMFKALRENCVVVIKEDGNHRLIGPFDTLLTERKDNKKPGQP